MAIEKDVLDQLLAGRNPKCAFQAIVITNSSLS